VLVPDQEWRTFWDAGHKRFESDLPRRYEATVDFTDSHGHAYSLDSILDWDAYFGRSQIEVYGAHHGAKALREISATLKGWDESGGGVAVHARDGDAHDARDRARREARRASSASDQDEEGSQ
jgi:hypothetical protein